MKGEIGKPLRNNGLVSGLRDPEVGGGPKWKEVRGKNVGLARRSDPLLVNGEKKGLARFSNGGRV